MRSTCRYVTYDSESNPDSDREEFYVGIYWRNSIVAVSEAARKKAFVWSLSHEDVAAVERMVTKDRGHTLIAFTPNRRQAARPRVAAFVDDGELETQLRGIDPSALASTVIDASIGSKRVVAMVVDGYHFYKVHGYADALTEMERIVCRAIGDNVVVPREGRWFFFPDPADALHHNVTDEATFIKTSQFLREVRRLNWTVVHTNFKLDRGAWRASCEDVCFSRKCDELASDGAFPPIGDSRDRATATDVVAVTADADHLSTLESTLGAALRWCALPESSPNAQLNKWGDSTRRLIRYTVSTIQGLCRNWAKNRTCRFGESCHFKHTEEIDHCEKPSAIMRRIADARGVSNDLVTGKSRHAQRMRLPLKGVDETN